ncbi:MAG: LysR family transcriptional regulator [Spirochaetaceae bacterium]|jgi:molybdate transport system regulatory protein|nr:LysR family transcriptional regulator [Spirochaetaceae bacterium]
MGAEKEPRAKILLMNNDEKNSFCGPGMIRLLIEIKETGSVRYACERMAMSYSKGWKLLRIMESCLGYPVTVRRQGGRNGGEARLTPEGLTFLENHQAFLQDCQIAIKKVFDRYYC